MPRYRITKAKATVYFFTALILTAVMIRIFIIDTFIVLGNSMAPTIIEGDYVLVNKMAYRFKTPQKQDVVVGDFRGLEGVKAIKRVRAVPGEWLELREGALHVSEDRGGESLDQVPVGEGRVRMEGEKYVYRLDPYEYFLSGDNDISSIDSFELGPVDSYKIDGRVIGIFRLKEFKYIKI